MSGRVLSSFSRVLALALVAIVPVALAAQSSARSADDTPSKWDIFAGYSYIAPHGFIETPLNNGSTLDVPYNAVPSGAQLSIARYFNEYVGAEFVGDTHLQSESQPGGVWTTPKDDLSGGSLGLIARYPTTDVTPFVHALVGVEIVGGPHWQLDTPGAALTAGGGLDYGTGWFHHHLAIRLFEADYQFIHVDYGNIPQGGRANINAIRLSAGFVYHIGAQVPPPPVTLACSVSPAWVYPGDPVTVTATPGELNPKMTPVYTWTGTGVTGNGTTATVATGALAGGVYTIKGEVKEGAKPGQTADCSASFTVKAFEPPTVSCSARPSTLLPGDTSTITAVGVSPQNRPLTYSYSATAGTITGTGTTAAFSSTGAPTGSVGITCNVSDDKGQTATANTSLTITAPYVKPVPRTEAQCSISFTKNEKMPTRVDNEAKACLDRLAEALKSDSTATLVVVGESTETEKAKTAKQEVAAKKNKHLEVEEFAAQRAVNTKAYLVEEASGIDASRIIVREGTTDGKTVEDYLVPSGATFDADVPGTVAVDEAAVKPIARKPLHRAVHVKAKSKAMAAK
jgi:hypothetical protein